MFSSQASKMRVTVGHVGVLTRYIAESCHSSRSRATRTTPDARESRSIDWSLAIALMLAFMLLSWTVRPPGHDLRHHAAVEPLAQLEISRLATRLDLPPG